MTQEFVEQAVLLGERRGIVGILTQAISPPRHDFPAVIILNTGLTHRVGRHRMFVPMARSLAKLGFPVLRFDFSGVGDSDVRKDALSPMASSMADIGEALDWLTDQLQISNAVLLGFCSGADQAVTYSSLDPRISALILMDPLIPSSLRLNASHLFRLHSWVKLLSGQSRQAREWVRVGRNYVLSRLHPPKIARHKELLQTSLQQSYRKAGDQDVHLLLLFSEESVRRTTREKIFYAFAGVHVEARLRLEVIAGSDHNFSRDHDRQIVLRHILEFALSIANFETRARARKAGPEFQKAIC